LNRLDNKTGVELLCEAIKLLELVPRTGYGEADIRLTFQNGMLIFTEDSFVVKSKTQLKIKLDVE
jgi:hypothetical protein